MFKLYTTMKELVLSRMPDYSEGRNAELPVNINKDGAKISQSTGSLIEASIDFQFNLNEADLEALRDFYLCTRDDPFTVLMKTNKLCAGSAEVTNINAAKCRFSSILNAERSHSYPCPMYRVTFSITKVFKDAVSWATSQTPPTLSLEVE